MTAADEHHQRCSAEAHGTPRARGGQRRSAAPAPAENSVVMRVPVNTQDRSCAANTWVARSSIKMRTVAPVTNSTLSGMDQVAADHVRGVHSAQRRDEGHGDFRFP